MLTPGTSLDTVCPGERQPGARAVNGPSGDRDLALVRYFNLDSYILDHNEVFPVFAPAANWATVPWAGGCRAV